MELDPEDGVLLVGDAGVGGVLGGGNGAEARGELAQLVAVAHPVLQSAQRIVHNPQSTIDHSGRAADIPDVALDPLEEAVGGGVVALGGDGRLAELALLARDDVAGGEAPRNLLEALADALAV